MERPAVPTSEDEIFGTLLNPFADEERRVIRDALRGRLEAITGLHAHNAILGAFSVMDRSTGTPSPFDVIEAVKADRPVDYGLMSDFDEYVFECSLMESRRNTVWHLERIFDSHARRRLSMIQKRVDISDDVSHAISVLRTELDSIEGGVFNQDKEYAIKEYSDEWWDLFNSQGEAQVLIPTGFGKLDHEIGGISPGDLFVIGARPSVGKTAFAITMADAMMSAGFPVSFYSFDMGRKQFMYRIGSFYSGLTVKEIVKKEFERVDQREGWALLSNAYEKIGTLPLYLTFRHMDAFTLRRAIIDDAKRGAKVVFVDYLQLVRHPDYKDEYDAVTATCKMLKDLTHELDIAILPLSQLRRYEGAGEKPPSLHDLRASGQIEQDASMVVLIHRPKSDTVDGPSMSFHGQIDLAKHQNGPTTRFPARIQRGFKWTEE